MVIRDTSSILLTLFMDLWRNWENICVLIFAFLLVVLNTGLNTPVAFALISVVLQSSFMYWELCCLVWWSSAKCVHWVHEMCLVWVETCHSVTYTRFHRLSTNEMWQNVLDNSYVDCTLKCHNNVVFSLLWVKLYLLLELILLFWKLF